MPSTTSRTGAPRRIKARETREEQSRKLVQAAYDLVGEVGISGLRTRDIAKRAEVHLATFHYCFESKQALLRTLYAEIISRFRAHNEQFATGTVSVDDTLRANRALRVFLVGEAPQSLRIWKMFIAEACSNPDVAPIVADHFTDMRARFARLVERGKPDGLFTHFPADTAIGGAILVSLFDGLLAQLVIDPDAFPIAEYEEAMQVLLG